MSTLEYIMTVMILAVFLAAITIIGLFVSTTGWFLLGVT